ncbi:MAG: hypothetical protein IJV82_03095 [Oscillospiraceae bacterium]|nr:hypothetical protein [Oscillospiraceae bacterium]
MRKWQKILFAVVLLTMLALIIVFWGSIASCLLVLGFVFAVPIFLIQKHVVADRENYFVEYDS